MISFTQNQFVVPAQITQPVAEVFFTPSNIQHFDNDGFQLNELEQAYYRTAGLDIHYCLGVWAVQLPWGECSTSNFILDHSMIITRCSYAGQALEQLKDWAVKYPYLHKYCSIKPKWGLDFALEYWDSEGYLEVLHIEQDYSTIEAASAGRLALEQKLQSTDWNKLVRQIRTTSHEWSCLQGMKQNDYRARLWGLDWAESTLKAF